MTTIVPDQRIRAFAFGNSNFFMRHLNGEGEINELDPNHLGDFNFTCVFDEVIINGETKHRIRFRGSFEPFTDHFFRHKNFRVLLEQQPPPGPDLEQFLLDSTFFNNQGLSDIFGPAENSNSFEAINSDLLSPPGTSQQFFIRHRDQHLFLNTLDTIDDNRDATFKREHV